MRSQMQFDQPCTQYKIRFACRRPGFRPQPPVYLVRAFNPGACNRKLKMSCKHQTPQALVLQLRLWCVP